MTDPIEAAARALLADLVPRSVTGAPGQHMLPPQARRDVGETPLWRAHAGPATLFVHGWQDTHRIWRAFAQDFLSQSRPVLLMDLPAHGASKALTCDGETAGTSVYGVCEAEAPVDAIIAHSFGCVAVAEALRRGAKADYVILIAPPLLEWAESKRRSGAAPEAVSRALEMLAAEGRAGFTPFDFQGALSGFAGKLLLIGSDADDVCPLESIEALGAGLGVEVHAADGWDHRELCLAPDVLAKIVSFLGYT